MHKNPKIAVIGSRDFPNQYLVERVVYLFPRNWIVVSGGARGVDTWAAETAKHHRRKTEVKHAEWGKYGKSAGFIRNNEIVRSADLVIAFWSGNSKGTKHTIQLAKYLNKPCFIVRLTT